MRTLSIITALALAGSASGRTIDLYNDGVINAWDINTMCREAYEGERFSDSWSAYDLEHFDFTEDGRLGFEDFEKYLELVNTPQGDFNMDGMFDEQDIVKLFSDPRSMEKWHNGDGAVWSQGDADCSDTFNEQDFVAMFAAGTYGVAPARAVPEPSTIVLLVLGFLTWRVRR